MGLVDGPSDFVAAQSGDHPFDLPPVAKTRHIPFVAASVGTSRGLQQGILAVPAHEFGSIVERRSSMNEGNFHLPVLPSVPFPDCRQMSSMDR
jgi:hypothetical protein